MKIKIILPFETVGYRNDAKIIEKYIKKHYEDYIINIETFDTFICNNVDVHIYISNIFRDITKFARINMMLINHELFIHFEKEKKFIGMIDLILARNNIGYETAKKIKDKNNYKYDVRLIKFTSEIDILPINKYNNMVLHSAGEHHWKQTDSIIKAWVKYRDLPPIIIICTGQCYKNIEKLIPKTIPSNMVIYNELIEYSKYIKIKNMIGIHLCPSIVEGYGHYINEARKLKSLVITTDLQPMNELINNKSGVLIKCQKIGKKRNNSDLCFIDEDEIYKTVKNVINLDLDKKNKMIENAYNDFILDDEYFDDSIRDIFNYIK